MNPFEKGVGTRSEDPETPVEAVKAKDILPPDKQKRQLPPIKRVGELVKLRPPQRPEIIKGILRTRCKMSLGGAAKARKTWQFLDPATAVATGTDWLKFETAKSKVLYINFESHGDTFLRRLEAICDGKEMSISEISENMSAWCLRGYAAPYHEILPMILDPTQKMLVQCFTCFHSRFNWPGHVFQTSKKLGQSWTSSETQKHGFLEQKFGRFRNWFLKPTVILNMAASPARLAACVQ